MALVVKGMTMASAKTNAVKTTAQSLRELRNTDKTLFAKNNTPFKITVHENSAVKVDFELEPKGQDDSIKILPKECLQVPGFQRLWMKKAVTISDDEAMEEQIQLLMSGQLERVQDHQDEILSQVEENSTKKNLIEKTCLLTGSKIFMTERDVNDGVPPLAEHVKDKAHLFIPVQKVDDKGNSYWNFNRVG